MIVPTEIVGKNRIRDLKICLLYLEPMDPDEICVELQKRGNLKLTERRVRQILSANAAFINPRMGWDKTKRLHKLIRAAKGAGTELHERHDILDVIKEIRTEMEGEKTAGNQTVIVQIHEQVKKAREARAKLSGGTEYPVEEHNRISGLPRIV